MKIKEVININTRNLIRMIIIISGLLGVGQHLVLFGLSDLNYFTVLSNIFVVALYIYIFFKGEKSNNILRLKGAATACILLTFLVYNVLILPVTETYKLFMIKNITLHYIVPILTFIDVAFYDNTKFKKIDPLLWALIPTIYAIVSISKSIIFKTVITAENSIFPYFFFDVYKLGVATVAKYILGIAIVYIFLSYFTIAVVNFSKKIRKK